MLHNGELRNPSQPLQGGRTPALFGADVPFEPWPYAIALVAVGAALGVAKLLQPVAGLENVDLVFLTAIVAVAARYGLWPSLVGSVASMLAYNFFFIPPIHTFAVADPTNLAALFFFLLVAVITSHLAARARAEALAARERAERTEALYAFSRAVAALVSVEEIATAATSQMASMLGRDVVLLLPDDARAFRIWTSRPEEDEVDGLELAAIRSAWAVEGRQASDRDALRLGERLFLPLRTSGGLVGVVGVAAYVGTDAVRSQMRPEEHRLLRALADQAAVAIERVRLAVERDEARLAVETERLRSAVLSSLSHDLKTPLASIIGAVTALRLYPDLYDAAARAELAGTIQEEAERLARFVANLLDMTRLEAGGINLVREPVDVGDVIGTALQRTAAELSEHRIVATIESDLPLLSLDAGLLEQVLVNVLDNAAKYAPQGSTVSVEARSDRGGTVLSVADEGPGLPQDSAERVFEKFFRANQGERRRAGTGLGLAICRGFVQALGGRIEAANRVDRTGAVFTVTFPQTAIAARGEKAAE